VVDYRSEEPEQVEPEDTSERRQLC